MACERPAPPSAPAFRPRRRALPLRGQQGAPMDSCIAGRIQRSHARADADAASPEQASEQSAPYVAKHWFGTA
jgi:hypothetical protein